jgi:pyruvate ferredoxin oxidoreductase alpha subunit
VSEGRLLTGNGAAAWGARLADVEYVPAFPITPQTEIIETIAKWVSEGAMGARMVQLESEHSMLTAAGAASLAGARVFTATSSQGLLYGMEMLYNISGWRAPLVLVNVSRALAAPIALEPDHNDVLAARDTGFVQLHAETCQEVLDLVLLGYRIAEDMRVRLPAIVNLDGFFLSFTRERVELPSADGVARFLPAYEPVNPFSVDRPVVKGSAVMEGDTYSYFRYHVHASSLRALQVLREASREYESLFGRAYGPVEPYMLEDAEYVLVMSNSFTTLGRQVVDAMRAKGVAAGLLKLRMIRPFPVEEVASHLKGRKVVAVFDQDISPGSGGIIYPEVAAALYHERNRPRVVMPVIGGLGGKRLTLRELEVIFEDMHRLAEGDGARPEARLMMRRDELERIRGELATAKGETAA